MEEAPQFLVYYGNSEIRVSWEMGRHVKNIGLYDVRGKLLGRYQTGAGTTSTVINTVALPAGIYLLQIRDGNSLLTKKVLIPG